ncbi:MAG TPA: hypothetical protein P5186_13020 [Candidatus Paceibacterota bacterium]|nr:hypothetical protein [Verrucomicrobiota bacterium]HRY48962.1 hypothetical protein [Candidatus Paceibacterota bacterium]HSA03696.1 hypothetical protein [Candidatus Paceibacterota bacterium]
MKTNDKILLLDRLSVCYNRVNYLIALCKEQALTDEANRLGRRKERLKLEIDGLLRDLYANWVGDAKALKVKLETSNQSMDEAIKEIERQIKVAENIVRATGYIDGVIKVAIDLVK